MRQGRRWTGARSVSQGLLIDGSKLEVASVMSGPDLKGASISVVWKLDALTVYQIAAVKSTVGYGLFPPNPDLFFGFSMSIKGGGSMLLDLTKGCLS